MNQPSDRQQQELELLGDRQHLEAFFSQSQDGFFFMMLDLPIQWKDTVDREALLDYVFSQQRVTKVNAAMLAQYGATEDEFIGLTPKDFFAHDLETGRQLWREMFDKGRLHVETLERKLDGSSMWVEGDYSCLYNSDGEIIGHFGIQRDISDRKKNEIALQSSEQRYATLAKAVPVGIFRTDAEGHCLYVNERWCEMTGLTFAEAQQDGWAQTLHPDDRERVFAEWYACAQHDLPFQSEYRFQKRNGDITWVVGQSVAEKGIGGEPIGYIGSITDISEAKHAEADLKQSEQRFRAIFDGTFQFMGVLTPEGVVTEANRTALDAIAVNLEDVVGQLFWATPWWTHSPVLQEHLKQGIARAAKGELARFEAEHILDDGTSVFVDFTLKPIVDEAGKVVMLIPEGRDITDRKQAEDQLRQQEAFLKSIYNGTEQAIFVVDIAAGGGLRYASFNPVSERYAGVSNAQIQGKTPEEAFGEAFGSTLRQNYERCLQTGTSIVYEELLEFKTHSIWTLTTLVPLRDEKGQIYRIIGTATDISDRKQIEEAFQESEQRLQALLDNSTAVIYMKDTLGRYMMINHRYEALFHLDRHEVKGKTDRDIFPKVIADAFQANDREVIAAGVALEKEEIAPQDDGEHTYLSIKFPLFDAEGEIYAVCGMSTDISDRKQKEEILRNISLGVATKTDKFLFQALAEYLTKTLDVEFAFISELIQPENERLRTIAAFGDGQVIENFEYALAHTPCENVVGKQICIYPNQVQQQFPLDTFLQDIKAESYMGVPLFDSAGQALGLITILSHQPLQDTKLIAEILNIFAARAAAELERQRAEVALQIQKQDLARSNAELQQFAYVASHDLQEPLRMVVSYLELLERRYKGQLDAKADMFIGYAVDGATRMQTLINDLLSYSRVGTRGQNFETVDCAIIVQGVLSNLQMAIAQSNAVITYDPLPQVHGDSSQLTQLFQNLISNAIKFRGEEPPEIHISVERTDDKWLFSVKDNGIGIEHQYLDRIFIIFQRLHSRTEYPGTGIGLAVCKKIVERHGGNLWVESQLGRGSTFHFTLPQLASNP
jgi:PAS domain S-box-containing protein